MTIAAFASLPSRVSLHGGAAAPLQLWQQGAVLADYSKDAISFFSGIRTPATLIAGSSLTALFTLSQRTKPDAVRKQSRLENRLVLIYHVCSLISLLLSINVILMTTATSTILLLGLENPNALSAYELLRRDLDYEFTLTRWSFLSSMFSFLTAVTLRILLEFDLLHVPHRFRTACFTLASVSILFFHLLSFVNRRLHSWPNLGAMTWDVVRMYWARCWNGFQTADILSLVSFVAAFGIWVSLWVRPPKDSTEGTQ